MPASGYKIVKRITQKFRNHVKAKKQRITAFKTSANLQRSAGPVVEFSVFEQVNGIQVDNHPVFCQKIFCQV